MTAVVGLAAYEAIERLVNPREVSHLWATALAAVIGFLGNEVVAQYRIRVGRRIGSAASVADGLHVEPMRCRPERPRKSEAQCACPGDLVQRVPWREVEGAAPI